MAQKPSIPKGTRDFAPEQMVRRNHIFDTIRSVFEAHGYQPIETPAMENLSTLLGKYGDEGDRLLFKVLNSGEFTNSLSPELLQSGMATRAALAISEKGLRYDLTVPFARFVVQNQNALQFPFKRYQIQPVWRADRPQKGRYREFYQCDIDVIGSTSMLNELELVLVVDEVFKRLGINTLLKVNNRKVLCGIAEYIGHPDRLIDITVAIDKLEKAGQEAVCNELLSKGIDQQAIDRLMPILALRGTPAQMLDTLRPMLAASEIGTKGIAELGELMGLVEQMQPLKTAVEIDETKPVLVDHYIRGKEAVDAQIGSVCGGGRYDDLTGIFGLKGMSGVGISFGADRIYDVMQQLDLFPPMLRAASQLMFANFGAAESVYSLSIMRQLRQRGISTELYPDSAKMRRQFDYANARQIPFVAIAGESEMLAKQLTIKNMTTGEQQTLPCNIDQIVEYISK